MFLEAPENLIDKIYVAESMLDDEEVMEKVRRFSWESVENGVFRQMCDTQYLMVLTDHCHLFRNLLRGSSADTSVDLVKDQCLDLISVCKDCFQRKHDSGKLTAGYDLSQWF